MLSGDVMAAGAEQHLLGDCHDVGLAGWSASGDRLHALLPQASQQAIQHGCARAQSRLVGPDVWLIGGPVDGVQALLHRSERACHAGRPSMWYARRWLPVCVGCCAKDLTYPFDGTEVLWASSLTGLCASEHAHELPSAPAGPLQAQRTPSSLRSALPQPRLVRCPSGRAWAQSVQAPGAGPRPGRGPESAHQRAAATRPSLSPPCPGGCQAAEPPCRVTAGLCSACWGNSQVLGSEYNACCWSGHDLAIAHQRAAGVSPSSQKPLRGAH